MSRYSPTVLPNPGPRFDPETISRAIAAFQDDRERSQDRAEAGIDRTRRRTREDVQSNREEVLWGDNREDRGRTRDYQEIEDFSSGIRPLEEQPSPPATQQPAAGSGMPHQVRNHPMVQEIARLTNVRNDPMAAAQPQRALLPGQLDSDQQGFSPNAGAVRLPSGRVYHADQTSQAIAARARSEGAARVRAQLGADDAHQELFRFDPEALTPYVGHRYGTERDSARDAAAMDRTRYTTDAANERNRYSVNAANSRHRESVAVRREGSGGAPNEYGFGRITWPQALDQARRQLGGPTGTMPTEPHEVDALARKIFSGEPIDAPAPELPPEEEPRGPGLLHRLGGLVGSFRGGYQEARGRAAPQAGAPAPGAMPAGADDVVAQYGRPGNELEEAIVAAIAAGESPNEIINSLAPEHQRAAREYLAGARRRR